MKKLILVGCGGVGSWLLPALVRQHDPEKIIAIDGDKLERKNLDRQLFSELDIGRNKAEALADKYGCAADPVWFSMGMMEIERDDWILVAADNHPARNAALQEADANGALVILAMNETWSAEAVFYQRGWRGGERDPRVYYPEIATVRTGDPRAAAVGCTGEAQTQNPQLVNANFMAAALALHLFALWSREARRHPREIQERLPYRLTSNQTRFEIHPERKPQT